PSTPSIHPLSLHDALPIYGRRLIGVARYGLCDHTSSKRCGGFELIGVVGSAAFGVPAALAAYRWLRQRRATAGDVHAFDGRFSQDRKSTRLNSSHEWISYA